MSARNATIPTVSRVARQVGAVVVAGVLGATLLAACGGDEPITEVTMLTHDSFSLPEEVLAAFTAETGLTLKVIKSGDGGRLASTVSLTPGSPKADLVYGIDNTFASRPIEAGALEPYQSPLAADGADEYELPNSRHELTAVDRGDVCLNVDDDWYREHNTPKPTSLRDLRTPAFAAQAVLMDPGTSSPGMAFLLATIGVFTDGWQGYWKDLVAGGVTIVGDWQTGYNQQFTAGEGHGSKPIVLSYASSPAATQGTSALLDSCFGQVEYVGILKGARNVDGARKAIDFLLAPKVQRALPDSMYVYPVQRRTPLPDGWAQRAPVPQWRVNLPPTFIAKNREGWLEQWRAAVGR
ncbi:MAG: thiamine ABC transporter substrate-binding protein [Gordonia sp. (in: high G+C Gram-positive bacteria)]